MTVLLLLALFIAVGIIFLQNTKLKNQEAEIADLMERQKKMDVARYGEKLYRIKEGR